MSSPTWTPAALSSEARPYAGTIWRLVEAQHRVSTLKVVDSLEEQAMLEDILEDTKPVVPPECRHLDYLLSTPFRYGAIYPHGSRFRRAGRTPGVYYGAETPEAAAAEMAFYRILFFTESPQTPWPDTAAEYTAIAAETGTPFSLDLSEAPLDCDKASWSHPTDYAACQALAETARAAGIEAIRYPSVRDPLAGSNVAILTCSVFSEPAPVRRQTWRIRLGRRGAQVIREHPGQSLEFTMEAFATDPRIAHLVQGGGKG